MADTDQRTNVVIALFGIVGALGARATDGIRVCVLFGELLEVCERLGSELTENARHEFRKLLLLSSSVECEGVSTDGLVHYEI